MRPCICKSLLSRAFGHPCLPCSPESSASHLTCSYAQIEIAPCQSLPGYQCYLDIRSVLLPVVRCDLNSFKLPVCNNCPSPTVHPYPICRTLPILSLWPEGSSPSFSVRAGPAPMAWRRLGFLYAQPADVDPSCSFELLRRFKPYSCPGSGRAFWSSLSLGTSSPELLPRQPCEPQACSGLGKTSLGEPVPQRRSWALPLPVCRPVCLLA